MPSRESEHIRYIADAIEPQLPENPALARRVLTLLSSRIGGRVRWAQMALAAGLAAGVMAGADAYENRTADTMVARIVEASDGLNYVVIYQEIPGTPVKVLQRLRISPEEAVQRLKTPGWEAAALTMFRGP
jgi:outer membrane lipoprotein SlyB